MHMKKWVMILDFEIKDLSNIEKEIEATINIFPKEYKKELREQANIVLKKSKQNFDKKIKKHDKDLIKRGWGIKVKKVDGDLKAFVFNKAPHSHLLEHGHNEYDFKGNPTGGFVEGYHVLEKTADELEKQVGQAFEEFVDKILGG